MQRVILEAKKIHELFTKCIKQNFTGLSVT